jgi:uncharacterized membrane protein
VIRPIEGNPSPHRLAIGIAGATFAIPVILWGHLPDPMPVHWDLHGTANGWMPRAIGAFFAPVVFLVVVALLATRRAPPGAPLETAGRLHRLLVLAVALLGFAMTLVSQLVAIGAPLDVRRVMPAAVGLLLAVLGWRLPTLSPNRVFGVRTPWTLADPRVWAATHRLAGPIFVWGGLGMALVGSTPLLADPVGPCVGGLAAFALIPVVYSFLVARRLRTAERGSGRLE